MPETLTEALRRLEAQLQAASVRSSRELVAELLTEDFREIGSFGRVYTRVDILETLAAEAPVHSAMSEFEAASLTDETALVTYKTVKKTAGAADVVSLRSSIWLKRDGRWRMRFHQGTHILA